MLSSFSQDPADVSATADTMELSLPGMRDGQNEIQLSGPTNCDAPITRLPNEVLAEIFHQGYISSSLGDVELRSSICLVSRHWRDTAIRTSSLWTFIAVESFHSRESIEVYLRRSMNRPLVVSFEISLSGKRLNPILPPLILSAYRWRKLIIDVYPHCLRLIPQFLHDIEAPLLEFLALSTRFEPPHNTPHKLFTRGAPKLSTVYVGDSRLCRYLPSMNNVTTFTLQGGKKKFEGSQFYGMLVALPSVINLVLQDVVLDFATADIGKKISMLSLRRIMITPRCGPLPQDEAYIRLVLADTISAPNLETLVIIVSVNAYDIKRALVSFAASRPKFPALRSLELWSCSEIPRDLFLSLPTIKVLTLIRCGDEVLQLLLGEEDGSVLLPELHTLIFGSGQTFGSGMTVDPREIGLICDLVSARSRLGIPLRKLRLFEHMYSVASKRMRWLQEHAQAELIGLMGLDMWWMMRHAFSI